MHSFEKLKNGIMVVVQIDCLQLNLLFKLFYVSAGHYLNFMFAGSQCYIRFQMETLEAFAGGSCPSVNTYTVGFVG